MERMVVVGVDNLRFFDGEVNSWEMSVLSNKLPLCTESISTIVLTVRMAVCRFFRYGFDIQIGKVVLLKASQSTIIDELEGLLGGLHKMVSCSISLPGGSSSSTSTVTDWVWVTATGLWGSSVAAEVAAAVTAAVAAAGGRFQVTETMIYGCPDYHAYPVL
jgi:hypothetical protein